MAVAWLVAQHGKKWKLEETNSGDPYARQKIGLWSVQRNLLGCLIFMPHIFRYKYLCRRSEKKIALCLENTLVGPE